MAVLLVSDGLQAPVTLATRADEAGEPPPTKIYELWDNLLLRDVWGYRGEIRTRTVDSHASRVRRKLGAISGEFSWLENVWNVGYRLLPEEA